MKMQLIYKNVTSSVAIIENIHLYRNSIQDSFFYFSFLLLSTFQVKSLDYMAFWSGILGLNYSIFCNLNIHCSRWNAHEQNESSGGKVT